MSIYIEEPLFAAIYFLGLFLLINLCMPAAAVEYHRISTLMVSLVALLLGMLSCLTFDKGVTGFQFTNS